MTVRCIECGTCGEAFEPSRIKECETCGEDRCPDCDGIYHKDCDPDEL